MGEHTKEPWAWKAYSNDIEGGEHGYTEIMSPEVECGPWCYGGRVSLNISDEDKARIVACVNACAGIPTADLAQPVYPAAVVRRLVDVIRVDHAMFDGGTSWQDYLKALRDAGWDGSEERQSFCNRIRTAALADVEQVGRDR